MERGVSSRRTGGELKPLVVGLLVVLVLAAAATALATAFATSVGREFEDLSRDPAAVGNLPNYIGYYANLTIYLWQIPGSAALLAAALLRYAGRHDLSRMFLTGGLLTSVMAIDDFFMIHETLNETLNVSQKAEPLTYALLIAAWTFFFRRRLRWNVVLVVIAMGFWGMSAALDALDLDGFVAEDGAKLFGVAVWTFMMMRLVLAALREVTLRTPEAVALDDDLDDEWDDEWDDDEPDDVVEPVVPVVPVAPRQEPVLAGAALRAEHRADADPATRPISIVPRQGPRGDGVASPVAATTRLPPAVSGGHRIPTRSTGDGARRAADGGGRNGFDTGEQRLGGPAANGRRRDGYDTGEQRLGGPAVDGGRRRDGFDTVEQRRGGRPVDGVNGRTTGEHRVDRRQVNGNRPDGHPGNGHRTNGYGVNGHQSNGRRVDGYRTNGHGVNGHGVNGHGVNGHRGHGTGEHRVNGFDTGEHPFDPGPPRHRPPGDE